MKEPLSLSDAVTATDTEECSDPLSESVLLPPPPFTTSSTTRNEQDTVVHDSIVRIMKHHHPSMDHHHTHIISIYSHRYTLVPQVKPQASFQKVALVAPCLSLG